MEELAGEFPDQAQRAAVCHQQWEQKEQAMKRSWYEIRNAKGDEAEVLIYDEIGFWGISAADFAGELKGITAPVISLRINSPGGEVFDGFAIYNALVNHPSTVHVTVDGLAASVASVIAQAGDIRRVAKNATLMIHEPYGEAIGNSETMRKMADELSKLGDTIAEIYADRAGGAISDWRSRMLEETWYRAQEAVDAGLADEVLPGKAKESNVGPRFFNLSRFRRVPDYVPQAAEEAVLNEAVPYRDEGKVPEGDAWEAPTLADFTDQSWDTLSNAEKNRIARHFVWSDTGMPPERFSDLGGPHHRASRSGVGPVVWRGVSNSRLSQASWSEDDAVRRHIANHYQEFDRTPPWEDEADKFGLGAFEKGVNEVVRDPSAIAKQASSQLEALQKGVEEVVRRNT